MNIGEAAAASGVSAKMIRYYERIGLIPPARRGSNGYRTYREADVRTLRFVARARALGFPMARVGELVRLWQDRRASAEVKAIAERQVAELRARIGELEAMMRVLEDLAQACPGDTRPECPIIDELAGRA